MKPAPFDYVRPSSLDEAVEALAGGGHAARVLAGGQSLVPAMNFRLARPSLLVDLAAIDGLSAIEPLAGGGLRIGAMVRQRAVERSGLVRDRAPLVADAMPFVAHPQIRNRGTIGGSLAHADPAAELPAVMLALDAEFHVYGPEGSRSLPAREFYLGLFATALEPGELLTAIELPAPGPGAWFAIDEVSRRHGDFALAGVALALTARSDGTIARGAVALFGVSDGPILSDAGAEALEGRPLGDVAEAADAVAGAVAERLDPPGDIHASPAFRRHLSRVLTRRTLERCGR